MKLPTSEPYKAGSGFTERGTGGEPIADGSSPRRSRYRLTAVLFVVIFLVGGMAAVSHDGAIATLGGIVPASFLLAHFGQELVNVGSGPAGTLLLALGLAVLVPLFLHLIRSYRRH